MTIGGEVKSGHRSVIGVSRPRIDSREKVTGATEYAADLIVPARGLLHARLVLSPYAHARIRSIDRAAALGVPGVVAVLSADDLRSRPRARHACSARSRAQRCCSRGSRWRWSSPRRRRPPKTASTPSSWTTTGCPWRWTRSW
ncbi:MAG: hypothetical protein FJ038_13595 [Chloroflexi bacterium]|nr:hypothetical protein [Chloroflexota bacterium]